MRSVLTTALVRPFLRLSRGLTLGVRGVVSGPDGVLLVRHSYVAGWYLPGGGVERGETVRQALDRELGEEANVSLLTPPRLHGLFSNDKRFPGDHVLVFVADQWRQDAAPKPNAEILETGFFPLSGLPKGISPGTRRRLAEIFEGAEPAEDW